MKFPVHDSKINSCSIIQISFERISIIFSHLLTQLLQLILAGPIRKFQSDFEKLNFLSIVLYCLFVVIR